MSTRKTYKVYVLLDPRNQSDNEQQFRYVGQTKQKLEKRLYQHIIKCRSPSQKQRYVNVWIRQLLEIGVNPEIKEMGRFSSKSAVDAFEQKLIEQLRARNVRLCNLTSGGDGCYKMSQITREKMSLSHKAEKNHFYGRRHSKATREKISKNRKGQKAWNKGLLLPDHCGSNNPFYGKTHSKKTKERISMAHARMWNFLNPSGEVVNIFNLAEFCRRNNLSVSAMNDLFHGVRHRKSHKGWRRVPPPSNI